MNYGRGVRGGSLIFSEMNSIRGNFVDHGLEHSRRVGGGWIFLQILTIYEVFRGRKHGRVWGGV